MKKTTKRSNKRIKSIKLNSKAKKRVLILAIAIVAMIMLVSTYIAACGTLVSYNGLGKEFDVEECSYDMDNLKRKNGRYSYKDKHYKSMVGVDVSQFQGDIDWKKVSKDHVDFAMIRLGYRLCDSGEIHLDKSFEKNIKAAKKAGLKVGVYFFSQASNVDEALEEAKFVIKHARHKGIKMPVAFDLEPVEGSDRITSMDSTQRTEVADAFCQAVEKAGYKGMVYGNQYFLEDSFQMQYLTNYETWLAHYAKTTNYWYKYTMWQYTDDGKVDGIDGSVDMNIYFVER